MHEPSFSERLLNMATYIIKTTDGETIFSESTSSLQQAFQDCIAQGWSLANADFAGMDVSGANFSGANLSGTDFTGARAIGCIFRGCKFAGTTFNGTRLDGADFSNYVIQQPFLVVLNCTMAGVKIDSTFQWVAFPAGSQNWALYPAPFESGAGAIN